MTAPARFTKADLKRAASGVAAAGFPIAKIEIDRDGKITIIPGLQENRGETSAWADLE